MTKQLLRILYWNIHGISSKSSGEKNKDPEFLKIANLFDITCLSELHTDKTVSIPGFVTKKQKFRKKLHKGPKIGGGIAVHIKQDIARNFQLLPNNNTDSIWLTTCPSQGKQTRLGFFYCSPENAKSNFFETVNREVESFGQDFDTHIFGDFNARIKDQGETLSYDKFDDDLGVASNILEPPPPRNSEDMKIINKRGKDLLDICQINDLIIANGRTVGDLFGTYTCHQKAGSSVVDYMLTSFKTLDQVIRFTVGTYMPLLSDHCSLQATINIAEMRKSELKKKVKKEIGKEMNRIIQKAAVNMTKMRFMKGETFERKKYVEEMNGHDSLKVLKTRLNMQPVYKNFKANVKLEKQCPYCVQSEDSTEHLVECKAVGRSMLTSEDLKDTEDIQMWRQITERITFNIENRKQL